MKERSRSTVEQPTFFQIKEPEEKKHTSPVIPKEKTSPSKVLTLQENKVLMADDYIEKPKPQGKIVPKKIIEPTPPETVEAPEEEEYGEYDEEYDEDVEEEK